MWAQRHSDRTANHTCLPHAFSTCPIDILIVWGCQDITTCIRSSPLHTLHFKPMDSSFAQKWLQSHEWSVLFHLSFLKTSTTTGGRWSIPKPQALAQCSTWLKSHDCISCKSDWNLERLREVKPHCSPAPLGTEWHHLIRNSILGSLFVMLVLSKPLHYSPKERDKSTWKKEA